MLLKIVEAGVIGYPAKKLHPALMAALAMASFPSMNSNPMEVPIGHEQFNVDNQYTYHYRLSTKWCMPASSNLDVRPPPYCTP
jgi:hypothetical protein